MQRAPCARPHLRGAGAGLAWRAAGPGMIGNEAVDREPRWNRRVGSSACGPGMSVRKSPPERYRVCADRGGPVLTCIEAPTVRVRITPGRSISAVAARAAAPGSIFLDGAASGEPFFDPKRDVYNLDHHEGCVRAITLATCEQAMVLIRKGLDLRRRDWTIHANDADLDTVLAIWVLLNHLRLNEASGETRARVMPLVRLEGTIDAQGLDLQDICALPAAQLAEATEWIALLREQEVTLKARGRWLGRDLTAYTAALLRTIDGLVYPPQQFDDLEDIEELARTPIAADSIAVVCRSTVGIYEVERQLRRLHGRRLGVIALRTGRATYSLRQVDPHLPATLDEVYTHLNLVDPAAGGYRSGNRWGGSAEIGGSPRGTGTQVAPEQIAHACARAFGVPSVLQRLTRVATAGLRSLDVMVAALATVFALGLFGDPARGQYHLAPDLGREFSVLLAALASAMVVLRGLRAPGAHGLRRPASVDWLVALPFALVGGLAGGVWIPYVPASAATHWTAPLSVLALPLAAEVVFRGLFHAGLVTRFRIQRCGGAWFLSWPTLLSAGFYAAWSALLQLPALSLAGTVPWATDAWEPSLGAFVFGAVAGMVRERSESLAAPILLHWATIVAVVLARTAII